MQTDCLHCFVIFRDIEKIKIGIAEQVSHVLALIMGCVIYVVMSFIYGWELTLIVVSYIPILFIMNLLIAKVNLFDNDSEDITK